MSSITSLISGGGGGGGETHIKTDPRQLTRSAGFIARFKDSSVSTTVSTQTNFWNYIDVSKHGAFALAASNNTYVNLLNITNATNGGYVHWILSPTSSTTNPTSTIRITVDGGTPYEFSYSTPATQEARMIMGGGFSSAALPDANNATRDSGLFWNSSNSAGIVPSSVDANRSTQIYDDFTNKVYGTGNNQLQLVSDFGILKTMPFERLKFESSILIQVKQQTIDSATFNNRAACFYSLK